MRFYLRATKYYQYLVAAIEGYNGLGMSNQYADVMLAFVRSKSRKEFLESCTKIGGMRSIANSIIFHIFPSIMPSQSTALTETAIVDCYAALSLSSMDKAAEDAPEHEILREALANCVDCYTPRTLMPYLHVCQPISEDVIRSVESDASFRAEIKRQIIEAFVSNGAKQLNFEFAYDTIPAEYLAVATAMALKEIDWICPSHWFFILSDLPPHCSFGWALTQLYPELKMNFSAVSQICCCNNFPAMVKQLDMASFYQTRPFIHHHQLQGTKMRVIKTRQERKIPKNVPTDKELVFSGDMTEYSHYYAWSCACRGRNLLVLRALEQGMFETAGRAAFHYADILSKEAITALRDCTTTRPISELVEKLQSWQPQSGKQVPAVMVYEKKRSESKEQSV